MPFVVAIIHLSRPWPAKPGLLVVFRGYNARRLLIEQPTGISGFEDGVAGTQYLPQQEFAPVAQLYPVFHARLMIGLLESALNAAENAIYDRYPWVAGGFLSAFHPEKRAVGSTLCR